MSIFNKTKIFIIAIVMIMVGSNSYAVSHDGIFRLTTKDVEKSISLALVETGIADNVSARISRNRKAVIYQHTQPISAEIKTLEYDEEKKSWQANLFIIEKGEVLSALPLGGIYDEMTLVPVLKSKLRNNEIITENDLSERAFSSKKLRKGTIYNKADLIGKTPERVVSAYRPIRENELQAPDIIKKGDSVNINFSTPNIEIKTIGEAMESGSKGQRIKIKNLQSGTYLKAEITASGETKVTIN